MLNPRMFKKHHWSELVFDQINQTRQRVKLQHSNSIEVPYRDPLCNDDILGSKPWKLPEKNWEIFKVIENEGTRNLSRNYNENNTFDYSDVNYSRRKIRKVINHQIFQSSPQKFEWFMTRVELGNRIIDKVDPY